MISSGCVAKHEREDREREGNIEYIACAWPTAATLGNIIMKVLSYSTMVDVHVIFISRIS